MAVKLTTSILAMLFSGLALCAVAGEPRPEPPVAPKELAAAAERWKLERAAERAAQPGAAGQHDLFWEVVKLWEADPKARADADLTAVVDWLLFTAGLWNDQNLTDPVYGKVPALVPALGDKLMDKRLAGWVGALQTSSGGGEPWTWADFPGLDKKGLAAAAGRLLKSGPKNNPVVRVWLAALLAAAGDDKGLEELVAARAALEKDLPSRAGGINYTLVNSLLGGGVKAGLPLLLDQAESDLAGGAKAARPVDGYGRPMSMEYAPGSGQVPWSLTRFHQMVGWPTGRLSAAGTDLKAELAKARTWLKDNYSKLAWDAKLRRFTGGTAQPGMEKLQAAAAAVEKKWNLTIFDRLISGQQGHSAALQELVGLMETQPEAIKDPAVGELLTAIVDDAGAALLNFSSSDSFRARLAKLSPELAGRDMAGGIKATLLSRNSSSMDYYLQNLSAGDAKGVKQAMGLLAPEMERLYAEAAKGSDQERTLNLALACLFTGAKLDKKELAALVAKAPSGTMSSGEGSLVGRAHSMARAGRTGGLRLLLAVGRKEIGRYATDGGGHPIRQFGQLAGWRQYGEALPGTAEEELARAEAWLDKYEPQLVWDRNNGRFTGAPPPGMEAAAALAGAVKERWGLKVDEALSGTSQDAARRLFSEILELMQKKPEAAADAGLAALALAMVEPGRIDDNYDELLRERLYVALPKLNREAGVKAWANMLRKRLLGQGEGAPRRDPSELAFLGARIKGYDPTVAAEAARALLPELKKSWETAPADKFDDRVGRAMSYIYAGGELPQEELDKLLAEADKLGSSGYSRFGQWAQPIAQAGNPAGLKLMLLATRTNRANRANTLSQFDYLIGKKAERYGGGEYFNLTEEQQIERVNTYLKWLEDNRKNLEFVPGQNRFKLKVEAPIPAPGPDPKKGPEVF